MEFSSREIEFNKVSAHRTDYWLPRYLDTMWLYSVETVEKAWKCNEGHIQFQTHNWIWKKKLVESKIQPERIKFIVPEQIYVLIRTYEYPLFSFSKIISARYINIRVFRKSTKKKSRTENLANNLHKLPSEIEMDVKVFYCLINNNERFYYKYISTLYLWRYCIYCE